VSLHRRARAPSSWEIEHKIASEQMKRNHSGRLLRLQISKAVLFGMLFVLSGQTLASKPAPHTPKAIVSDWSHRYVLYKESDHHEESSGDSRESDLRKDPRREQSWYLRHREAWWPEYRREHREDEDDSQVVNSASKRDWSINLGAAPSSTVINFSFALGANTAYGSVNVTDQGGGVWLATSGSLTVTGGADAGTWTLIPGGPAMTTSPLGGFTYDNLVTPANNPVLDTGGLLFGITGKELNVWGTGANTYSFYDFTTAGGYGTQFNGNGTFNFQPAPGGGQSTPAKYTFDITGAPSCANDFVAVGIAATPASGGQANIVGVNNLYSTQPASGAPNCTTNGPTVKFAYASGTGQVPASIAISLNGTQLAYVENLSSGKSLFHVLTIGTGAGNGTSPTAAVVPGTGNNAVDRTVVLSPDGGVTNQSSTSAPFISYTDLDVADTAYVTTYSNAGAGSGYLYKIGNVFNGSAPTIIWKVSINAIPGPPVYNTGVNSVFFTDSNGRIDYVVDSGTTPTVTYGPIVAAGTTSLNPVIVDYVTRNVYATFNTNGTNAVVVQAPASLASFVSVAVGTGNTTYTGPYGVEFNNAWYTGSGTPLLYVVGTGAGTTPTLYSVGFGSGVLNGTTSNSTALVSAAGADASPLTEFYNPNIAGGAKDFLFVGVTNHCRATTGGGTAGCVMSLNITAGFPTVNANTTALAASGGTTEIVIDNDIVPPPATVTSQASSIYYGTKTGNTLVKATQNTLQ
jgi:hypothetical protein